MQAEANGCAFPVTGSAVAVSIFERGKMVLLGRIELPTSSLPMTRSTTELQQQPGRNGKSPLGRRGLWLARPALSSTHARKAALNLA